MHDSVIQFVFTYRGDVQTAFDTALDGFDRLEEAKYVRNSDRSITMRTNSVTVGVEVDTPELHAYDIDQSILGVAVNGTDLLDKSGFERLENILTLVKQIYDATEPAYAFGMHSWRVGGIESPPPGPSPPITDESLAADRIEAPTWLMLFPPAMVETYGEEWLCDLPVDHVETLNDGALLLITTDAFVGTDPADYQNPDEETAAMISDALEPIEAAFETTGN